MSLARIVSPWVNGIPAEGGIACNHFKLTDDHPRTAGMTVTDVTGQPAANLVPTPNLVTVEVTNYTAPWLAGVQVDSTYTVLWSQ